MRIGDMQNITKHNIKNGCIDFVPQKTKRKKIRAIVPITKPVAEILERYQYKLPFYVSDRALSDSLTKFCAKIKELQHEVSYIEVVKNKQVTKVGPKFSILDSHAVGRKTFINLCIERKVQLTAIAGMTGHTEIDTIIKYYADKHANKQTALAEVFEM